MADAEVKFNEKWSLNVDTGCWEWTGTKTPTGYGRFRMISSTRENMHGAHRCSWAFYRGQIPKGKYILHRCNNPSCVNPDHLYVGTQSENMRDAVAAGTHNMASKTHCKHGHEYTPENTGRYKGSRYCRECNRKKCLARYHANRAKLRNGGRG